MSKMLGMPGDKALITKLSVRKPRLIFSETYRYNILFVLVIIVMISSSRCPDGSIGLPFLQPFKAGCIAFQCML